MDQMDFIDQVQVPRYPRLRHCTLVARNDNDPVLMVVGRRYFEIDQLAGSRADFLKLKSHFDGRHSIECIADSTGLATSEVIDVVQTFADLGLFRNIDDPPDFIATVDFLQQIDQTCEMWARQIGYHKLFGLLERGEIRREVFVGLILETYHYVRSAAKHISTALSHCQEPRWMPLLTRYLAEEHDHASLLLCTLQRLGVPREHVLSAHPLIGTQSLINMLCEIGRQSSLAYLLCTTLFEARKDEFSGAKESLESIARRYGFPAEFVAPVISHMSGDLEAGHVGLIQQALDGTSRISLQEANESVNWLHDLKHAFDQYHDQILQYYSDISNYIPRLKVDYVAL